MSKVSDFVTKQNEHNDRLDKAVDGLVEDVKFLNDKITEIQNSAGEISPEDQASLDALTGRGETLAAKLEALDGMTPPKAPPVES